MAPVLARQLVAIGELASTALELELALDPKPGLVTPLSRGSHDDMDESTFRTSIDALRPYFIDCARLGAAGADFATLRARGQIAEVEMFAATRGINTHKGAIFNLGLLTAAAGWQVARGGADAASPGRVVAANPGRVVAERWAPDFLGAATGEPTHGSAVRLRHGIPGAREHAAAGFPVLFEVALPAMERALARGADQRRAGVHTLLSIIAVLGDTNLVHRGGPSGLAWAQVASEAFLASGSVFAVGWERRLRALAGEFVARWLSPGGAADLLAATWFVQRLGAGLSAPVRPAALAT